MNHHAEILLAEDDASFADIVTSIINETNLSINVNVAKNGHEAISILNKNKSFSNAAMPDIILLDLHMPIKGGFEVLQEIKADASLASIPVIIFSSSNSAGAINRSYQLHANSYVVKPSNLEELALTLKDIIEYWFRVAELPRNDGASISSGCHT